MIGFNPIWGGNDYIQDTPPYDGLVINFLPSVANDVLAATLQLDSAESTQSFMQSHIRASVENMYELGLIMSDHI